MRQKNDVKPIDAVILRRKMQMTHDEFGTLLATSFVNGSGGIPVQIVGERVDENSVQNDVERVYGLTFDRLDRIHRLARLHRAVGSWSYPELDLVLEALDDSGVGSNLNAAMLAGFVDALAIGDEIGVSNEEIGALFASMPMRAIEPGAVPSSIIVSTPRSHRQVPHRPRGRSTTSDSSTPASVVAGRVVPTMTSCDSPRHSESTMLLS